MATIRDTSTENKIDIVTTTENNVTVTQPSIQTVEVLTGPKGNKGDAGPAGPTGSFDNVTGSFATTGSNTFIGNQTISGSINISSSLIASGLNYPTVDGDNGDILVTDGNGNLTFDRTRIYVQVKNISGTTLQKGTPVHVSSSVGNLDEVIAASASVASTMPATFVLAQDLNDDEEGLGILTGFINGVDTSNFGEGDVVYVGANGGYTNVKPTGSNLIQNLGIVTKVAVNGSGFIYGSGRANDVPNLLKNQIFFGSGSNQTYQTHISSALDSTIINNITSSGNISSSGEGIFSNIQLPGSGRISFDDQSVSDQYITGYDNNIIIDADDNLDLRADTEIKFNSPVVTNRSNGTLYQLTGSISLTSSINDPAFFNIEGPITASSNISSSGTFYGDGSGITGVISSSYALTASHALNAGGGSAFPFVGDAVITGSLVVSGSGTQGGLRTNTRNIILGQGAGNNQNPTNGPYNVMIGYQAGYTNTTGDSNVCIGQNAGYALSTNASDDNIFIGKLAGAGGTSPAARMSDANYNIALGYETMLYLTSGDSNIGFGFRTMRNISSGKYNLAYGDGALYNTDTGQNNIGIGRSAGAEQTAGTGNITIGSGSLGVAGESNQLRIGNGNTITTISASLETGDIIFASTASAEYLSTPAGNLSSISASYALTASHALNAGGGGAGFPFTGDAVITGSLVVSASATSQSLSVQGSGSTVFDVIGSVGTLFSIDDDLNGMLFTANDISGFPVLQASASGDVFIGKTPQSLYTTTVISSTTAATTHSLCILSTSSYDGAFFEYTAISSSNARAGNIMSVWNGANIVSTETTSSQIGDTTDLTTEVIISGSTARLVAYGANASYKIKTIIKAI
jgi:hypothetical protein